MAPAQQVSGARDPPSTSQPKRLVPPMPRLVHRRLLSCSSRVGAPVRPGTWPGRASGEWTGGGGAIRITGRQHPLTRSGWRGPRADHGPFRILVDAAQLDRDGRGTVAVPSAAGRYRTGRYWSKRARMWPGAEGVDDSGVENADDQKSQRRAGGRAGRVVTARWCLRRGPQLRDSRAHVVQVFEEDG